MGGTNLIKPIEVGYRAADLQDPIVSPCRQPQPSHRALEHLLAFGINPAVSPNHARGHRGIGKDLFTRETFKLALARVNYSTANSCRTVSLRRGISSKLAKLYCRHIDMNVDTIQKWTRDSPTYRCICNGVQRHSRVGSFQNPQGHPCVATLLLDPKGA